jgi:chitin disaccharide deacetylase
VNDKRLIINADDYGIDRESSQRIRLSHLNGIVQSATVLTNFPCALAEVELGMRIAPQLRFGVHLNLTKGIPLSASAKIPNLINKSTGNFYNINELRYVSLNEDQIIEEWDAQIRTLESCGLKIDHLDSHHHVSYMNKICFRSMLYLAHKYQLPIRFPPKHLSDCNYHSIMLEYGYKSENYTSQTITDFFGISATKEVLLKHLSSLTNGCFELMCHPGKLYYTPDQKVVDELVILTSKEIRQAITEYNIKLSTFSEIPLCHNRKQQLR